MPLISQLQISGELKAGSCAAQLAEECRVNRATINKLEHGIFFGFGGSTSRVFAAPTPSNFSAL
jgi:hypothetical protein